MKTLIIWLVSIFLFTPNTSHATDLEDFLEKYHTALNLESLFYTIVETEDIKVLKDEVISESAYSKSRHIILDTPGILNLGKIEFIKRDPKIKNVNSGFPTALVLAGTRLGMSVIDYIPEVPNYSVVTINHKLNFNVSDIGEALSMVEDVWKLQAHYIIIYSWLIQQAEVNPYLISSVNISFGSYIAPLPLSILQSIDITPHTTVFAFGGSALMPFVDEYLVDIKNNDIKNNIKKFVKPVLDVFNSDKYLKKLKGPFLVINASDDSVIPEDSNQSMVNHLKQAGVVDIFTLQGPHINVDQPEMIQKSINTIFDWINRQPIKSPFNQ